VSLGRLCRDHTAAVGPGRRGDREQAGQEEADEDRQPGGGGVGGDDQPYSAQMLVGGGEGRRTRRLVLGLSAVLALGSAAGVSGASGPPARTGKLTVGVWPAPARLGHDAVVEIGEAGGRPGSTVIECVARPVAGGGPSTGSAGAERCTTVVLGAGGRASTRFQARRPGTWSVSVQAGNERVIRPVEVVPGRLRMLATGDSEIQELDDMLAGRLAGKGVRVTGEAHISTGISKPFMFDWVKHAAAQAASLRPDITVVFIGANDGFGLPTPSGQTANCCGQAWVDAFARRTESMMESYLRQGAGRVFWFTLPTPRVAAAQPVFRAINRAYAIAAAAAGPDVELIDLVAVFTPGNRYRQDMSFGGRTVDVREPDGYHLSLGGDAIAAGVLITRLQADGLVR
jgi:lysophospholipase L1-like esterase